MSGFFTGPSAPVTLALRPAALTPLGHRLYALLVFEDETLAAHAEPGAVAVAYLLRKGRQWTVLRTWPEVAWTGNDGHAADSVVIERLGGKPLALFASSYMGQGQNTVSDWVIELAPKGPAVLGRIPLAGSLTSGCDRCGHYEYQGHVTDGAGAGELLSLRYVGWTAPPGEPDRRRAFVRRATFAMRNGKLAPSAPLRLPD